MVGSKNKIDVKVATRYLAAHSEPGARQYLYAYTITITNAGTLPCQLIGRRWLITDGMGKMEEVRGLGLC